MRTVCVVVLLMVAAPAAAQNIEVNVGAGGGEIAVDYYTPEYYLDYPVYFDNTGRPIYYIDGQRHYVPRTYVHYHGLQRHYRRHRVHYRRWYDARGHRYRRYRRAMRTHGYDPLYHDGYLVFYDASGVPFYWADGRRVWIPRTHPRHRVYRTHYTTHRKRYRTWYRRSGRRYHGYRRHRRGVRVDHRRSGTRVDHRRSGTRVDHRRSGTRVDHRRGTRVDHRRSGTRVRVNARHGTRVDHRRSGTRVNHRRVNCARNPGHPSCRGNRRDHRRAAPAGNDRRRRAAPDRRERRRRHRN